MTHPITPDQGDERRAIIRAAVVAMPSTNPLVADDLIEGHTMHTEADDIVAIWKAAQRAAVQPVAQEATRYRCSNCKSPLRPGWVCDSCDSEESEPEEIEDAAPQPSQGAEPVAYLMRRASGTTWALAASEMTDDVRRAFEMDDIEIIPLAAPHPPVSAEASKGVDAGERVKQLMQSHAGRIYIAGPMTGLPEFNFPAFNAKAAELRAEGWHVENPAEHGHVAGAKWSDYLRYDLTRIATCEAVYLLPGWSVSKGATLEVQVASALGMQIIGESVAVSGEVSDTLALLVECRDAFPVPPPGSPLEQAWAQAMGEPECIPDYLRAAVLALAGSAKQAAALERMARLDDEMGIEP